MSPIRPDSARGRRTHGLTQLRSPGKHGEADTDPRLHLESAKSLVAAARLRIDKYLARMDALSPLVVDVAHVIDAADLLDAAEEALHGGRR